jgi:hypothetical protein
MVIDERGGRHTLFSVLFLYTHNRHAQRFFADSKPPTTGGPTPVSPSSEEQLPEAREEA